MFMARGHARADDGIQSASDQRAFAIEMVHGEGTSILGGSSGSKGCDDCGLVEHTVVFVIAVLGVFSGSFGGLVFLVDKCLRDFLMGKVSIVAM